MIINPKARLNMAAVIKTKPKARDSANLRISWNFRWKSRLIIYHLNPQKDSNNNAETLIIHAC